MAMMDKWTDRLSEYLDGDLPLSERRELEKHLESCFECHSVLAELREVVARGRTLPDAEPANDLWSGIAERIGDAPVQTADVKVIDFSSHQASRPSRRFAFSLPQLAAAAIALMV